MSASIIFGGDMLKWNILYIVREKDGSLKNKETVVYGKNPFDAYANAVRILKIIERGKIVESFEIDMYNQSNQQA